MRKSFRKVFATAAAGAMALALTLSSAQSASAITSKAGEKAAKAEFDASGSTTYHAYFGFQQKESWIFRDEWYSDTLGIDGSSFADTDYTYDCGKLLQSGTDGLTAFDGTQVYDVEITGNGTYVVGVSGLANVLDTDPNSIVSMIYASTDIPMTALDNPVTISDWKLTIDGMEQALPADVYFPSECTDVSGLVRFDAVNTYQQEKGDYPDCPVISTPQDSIWITFTVSGMDTDNAEATGVIPGTETEDTTDDATSATSATSAADTDSDSTSGGMSTTTIVVIVIVAVVVIGGVIFVVTKKRKD